MKMTLARKLLTLVAVTSAQLPALAIPVTLTQIVVPAVPKETVASTQVTVSGETKLQFDVSVSGAPAAIPTGAVTFTLTSDGSAPVTATVLLSAGTASWRASLPTGVYSISAAYSGDTNYQPQSATATGSGATPSPDFDFSTPVIRIKQGQSWSGTIQLIPLNGFAQSLSLTCVAPPELGCTLPTQTSSVAQSNAAGHTQQIPISIMAYPGRFTASLSFLLLPLTVGFRVRRRVRLAACCMLSSIGILLISGCGTGTGAGWERITPKGTYQVSIAGASGSLKHVKDLTVIVE